MKMDENKKIFPIFLENKGEKKEISEYTHSPKERPQSYIMTLFGCPYKEDAVLPLQSIVEKKNKRREVFERMKQYMEETE